MSTRDRVLPRRRVASGTLVAGLLAGLAACAATSPASAYVPPPAKPRNCQTVGTFERFLEDFKKEAAAAGVSRATISSALDGMTADPGIIQRDRRQSFFSQTFLEVVGKLASKNRESSGRNAINKHRTYFSRAEKDFGVPPAPMAAFWALESDFGVGMGNLPVLRSLATLAYDCRRSELFRQQLLDALKIIDRGDLKPAEMVGSWAGELGQTQFLPTHYLNHGVDYDGDGRRDLLRSPADVIGSTASFMKSLGWRRGEPWLQEVRVPDKMPWEQAGLDIKQPRSQWVKWGVTSAHGLPLPSDAMPASLVLPMGRNGPAFLAYANFEVFTKWNQSLNYATTAAYLATRIDGAPALSPGRASVAPFGFDQTKDLQRLLAQRGYYRGEIDGRLGVDTRAAIKAAQSKLGLPADSYPSPELVAALSR